MDLSYFPRQTEVIGSLLTFFWISNKNQEKSTKRGTTLVCGVYTGKKPKQKGEEKEK